MTDYNELIDQYKKKLKDIYPLNSVSHFSGVAL